MIGKRCKTMGKGKRFKTMGKGKRIKTLAAVDESQPQHQKESKTLAAVDQSQPQHQKKEAKTMGKGKRSKTLWKWKPVKKTCIDYFPDLRCYHFPSVSVPQTSDNQPERVPSEPVNRCCPFIYPLPPPPPSVSDCPVNQPEKVPSEPVDDDLTDTVSDHLLKLGFSLKREKVADCLRQLGDLLNGLDAPKKAEICFQKFLFSDLHCCGSAILPNPSELKGRTTLDGPFILQVDKIINFCTHWEELQGIPPPGIDRRLFLTMTDGVHTVHGMESSDQPIEAIQVCACVPLGLKVEISNVEAFNGTFYLLPKNIRVLGGGLVDDPVTVSQRCMELINLWNREANKDAVPPVSRHYKLPDDLITEGCNKTSGLVVCFGEMLIEFVSTAGPVSFDAPSGYKKAIGGATTNVAVGISKLGGSSAFISKVGSDEYGHTLADILKENNVDISGMRFDSNFNNALALVTLKADGERKFLLFGNSSADLNLDKSELDHDLIKKAKIFHYGSIGLIAEQCKAAHLAALRIAKDSNCILSYDPKLRLALWPSAEAARSGIMSIWHLADVIKISEDEITFLIDRGDPYDDDVVLDKLFHPNPNLKLLIVTGGSEGCRYYTQGFKGKVGGVNVKPVDTTGAGDAFVSGILYNIASDPSIFEDEERLQKALYFANVCGAITVTERGAISALPTKDAVLQFYAI